MDENKNTPDIIIEDETSKGDVLENFENTPEKPEKKKNIGTLRQSKRDNGKNNVSQ